MEQFPDTRFSQPDPGPSEDVTIRDIMMAKGISYANARAEWDKMKAEVNKKVLDNESEDEKNG